MVDSEFCHNIYIFKLLFKKSYVIYINLVFLQNQEKHRSLALAEHCLQSAVTTLQHPHYAELLVKLQSTIQLLTSQQQSNVVLLKGEANYSHKNCMANALE